MTPPKPLQELMGEWENIQQNSAIANEIISRQQAELESARAENERLRAALEFYAHGDGAHAFFGPNEYDDDVSKVEFGGGYSFLSGKRARKALQGEEGK